MKSIILRNGKIIMPEKIFFGDLKIKNGKIVELGENLCADGCELIDVSNKIVVPGFIDIHTHGGYGSDFMDSTCTDYVNALKYHTDNGTTTVVPTSCTAQRQEIIKFLEFSKSYISNPDSSVATVYGVHLEGPYLSEKNKGAQKQEDLAVPSRDDYSYMLDYSQIIKTVTIAPELDGAVEMTKKLSEKGIVVCGGHDDGVYPEFIPAIENGLKHITHLYCVTSEIRFKNGTRNVGLREYALLDDNLTAEIIADNKHVPVELAKLIIKTKGVDKLCLVSDSLRCAGLTDDGTTEYTLGTGENAQKVVIRDGVAVLSGMDKYAGSVTCVKQMVKNMIDIGVDINFAVKMATLNPAKIIGIQNITGSIEVGKLADICVLNEDFGVEKVFIKGKEVC